MSSGKHLKALVILTIAVTCFICSFSAAKETAKQKAVLPMHEGTVKTIYAGSEIIDCVPIPKEIDIEVPELLKNSATHGTNSFNGSMIQKWRQYGECPHGTAAKLRLPAHDQDYFRRMKGFAATFGRNLTLDDYDNNLDFHEYAIVKTPYGKFYGGAGKISVWRPYVERGSEFSLAQMWLVSGLGDTTETLEVGWHVYPNLYHDEQRNEPRLFIFWTADSYRKTGCYNLNCDAFKHTSGHVTPGASILDYSKVDGKPITLDIEIVKEERTKHWWLKINNEVVGYWPGNLFKWLDDGALTVEWGGEIINDVRQTKSHTSSEMGSGLFPSDGVGKSAFAHTLKVIKTPNGPFKDPPNLNAYKTNVKCYDLVRNRYGFPYVGVKLLFRRQRQDPSGLPLVFTSP